MDMLPEVIVVYVEDTILSHFTGLGWKNDFSKWFYGMGWINMTAFIDWRYPSRDQRLPKEGFNIKMTTVRSINRASDTKPHQPIPKSLKTPTNAGTNPAPTIIPTVITSAEVTFWYHVSPISARHDNCAGNMTAIKAG